MSTWQSKPIVVNGFEIRIQADAEGVDFGKLLDGIYSSDLLVKDTAKARAIASALIQGANVADAARGGK